MLWKDLSLKNWIPVPNKMAALVLAPGTTEAATRPNPPDLAPNEPDRSWSFLEPRLYAETRRHFFSVAPSAPLDQAFAEDGRSCEQSPSAGLFGAPAPAPQRLSACFASVLTRRGHSPAVFLPFFFKLGDKAFFC